MNESKDKYSVSARCLVLQISRSSYYDIAKEPQENNHIKDEMKRIFKERRKNYGTRKIRQKLAKVEILASRRRIGRIVKELVLVSNDTIA